LLAFADTASVHYSTAPGVRRDHSELSPPPNGKINQWFPVLVSPSGIFDAVRQQQRDVRWNRSGIFIRYISDRKDHLVECRRTKFTETKGGIVDCVIIEQMAAE
jgi:hypothetical protein